MGNKNNIKYKYIFSKEYNPVYTNGAFGGISSRGEIIVNFYFERHGIPISQSYEVTDEGKLGGEIGKEPDDLQTSMVRMVENGIILNLLSAKEVHAWLGKHIKKLEQLSKMSDIDKPKGKNK